MLEDRMFRFTSKIHLGLGAYIKLDAAYISNGSNDPPTIRVRDVCQERGREVVVSDYYIDQGEAFYEPLLAQAEEWGAKCRECDVAADRARYFADKSAALAARHAAE
jgi:hypothetical protein